MQIDLLINLAVALGLGLLVGVERERSRNDVAGVRTFTLITLFGVMAGTLAQTHTQWLLPAALLAVIGILVIGNVMLLKQGEYAAGMTTEVAALLMFAIGVALSAGMRLVAMVVAGTTALLLHWKEPLHTLVERMGERDLRAVMRLALIGLVILPVLPDVGYGPYNVINPFQIWLMVVLIVGISLASYVVWRIAGAKKGVLLSGALGGLISSTAATVGYARRTRQSPQDSVAASVMIMIASAIVFGRVILEIAIVAPGQLLSLAPPLAIMLLFTLGIGFVAFRRTKDSIEPPEGEAPSDLRAAITFGLLYGAVLLGVAYARQHLGTGALYGVAAISGLTDINAITLSTAQLVRAGGIEPAQGWRLILVGSMANLLFKGTAVVVLGDRALARRVVAMFALAIAAGGALLVLWPG